MKKNLFLTKNFLKLMCFAICFSVIGTIASASQAFAYFDRGAVNITSISHNQLTLAAGTNANVSITFDEVSRQGTVGCGMEECPSSCGPECLNEYGECICAGPERIWHYTKALLSSSNPSVATAEWDAASNQIVVKGITKGTATITVTPALHEMHAGNTATITVTVN